MPNIPYRCVDCDWQGCRYHNAKKCLKCGGRLIATKPRGSRIYNDHNAMEMLREGLVDHVQRAECRQHGEFVAWTCSKPGTYYGDDPVEAIYKAANGEST